MSRDDYFTRSLINGIQTQLAAERRRITEEFAVLCEGMAGLRPIAGKPGLYSPARAADFAAAIRARAKLQQDNPDATWSMDYGGGPGPQQPAPDELATERRRVIEECVSLAKNAADENDLNESKADAMGMDCSAKYHYAARKEIEKLITKIRALAEPQQTEQLVPDGVVVPRTTLEKAIAIIKDAGEYTGGGMYRQNDEWISGEIIHKDLLALLTAASAKERT